MTGYELGSKLGPILYEFFATHCHGESTYLCFDDFSGIVEAMKESKVGPGELRSALRWTLLQLRAYETNTETIRMS